MTMRITGMNSGLDTESIIQELVKAKKTKSEKLTKQKTSLEWKGDAWKDLNTKIKSFYSKYASNLRFSSSYLKKSTSVSNTSAAKVITGDNAMNSVQKLSITQLAKSGYMTGATVSAENGSSVTADSLVTDLAGMKDVIDESTGTGKISVTANGTTTDIEITTLTKVSDVVSKLKSAGLSANFDEKNQRFYISSATSGADADFALTAGNDAGFKALSALGLNSSLGTGTDPKTNANAVTRKKYEDDYNMYATLSSKIVYVKDDDGNNTSAIDYTETLKNIDVDSELYKAIKAASPAAEDGEEQDLSKGIAAIIEKGEFADTVLNTSTYATSDYSAGAVRIAGQNCKITLNDVVYENATNNVEVNGLTITCLAEADDITVTTQDDTDGIYDMVRDFITEYNNLIKEMDKLYNADSASKYEPLTDDEKDEMSDTEIEKWETKIKDALLRKDTTLGTLSSAMKSIMQAGYEVNGKTMYLSNFGISTLSYFTAADNEKAVLHIDGDEKDGETSGNADKLKSMIANDPQTVVDFFVSLSRDLYKKMTDLSASSDYSSSGSFYDDKKIKSDISDYTSKISDAEDKLADYEDKYYKKFSNMEVALSKLQSSTNSLTSMLGS